MCLFCFVASADFAIICREKRLISVDEAVDSSVASSGQRQFVLQFFVDFEDLFLRRDDVFVAKTRFCDLDCRDGVLKDSKQLEARQWCPWPW